MNPKISVITASYNADNTIEQTIVSIAAQTYGNVEHIVVDGGSTDKTIEILKRYKNERLKWISESDNGITDAFCKGISLSSGDYILFLGADDALVGKNVLQYVSDRLKNVDILCGTRYTVDEESKRQFIYKIPLKYRNKKHFNGMMTATEGMFIKRNILLYKYPLDVKYKICMDYKFFLQAFYDKNINMKFIDEPIAFFSNGGVSNKKIKEGTLEIDRIYNELKLPFHCNSYENIEVKSLKSIVKYGLNKVGLLEKLIYINNFILHGDKHSCDNEICRWCGRR